MTDPQPSHRFREALPSPGSRSIWALCIVVSLVLGALLGFAFAPAPLPNGFKQSVDPTIDVVAEPFDDARELRVEVTRLPGQIVRSPIDGTITRIDCAPGGTWTSGRAPVAIDGSPLLALSTSVPPYRSISPGTTGADVEALHAELRRLGTEPPEGPLFTEKSAGALSQVQANANAQTTGTLDPQTSIWLSEPDTPISECPAQTGQRVTAGEPLAVSPDTLENLNLAAVPEDGVPGERVAVLGDLEIPASPDGSLKPNAEQIAELRDAPVVKAALDSEAGVPLTVTWRLAEPVRAAPLPPSALLGDGGSTCVIDPDGAAHAVDVLSSELGRTYVTFSEPAPTAVRTEPDPRTPCQG
ncbi:hypothetical protein [Zhihengliuella sp.]|uniref:hypothetical protein n=1 Tax=Zhihengliuella sp. TaxID=1954483 RepID=UPI0028128B3B|nr:hypothetical protein [Zhihengliuella sp.]